MTNEVTTAAHDPSPDPRGFRWGAVRLVALTALLVAGCASGGGGAGTPSAAPTGTGPASTDGVTGSPSPATAAGPEAPEQGKGGPERSEEAAGGEGEAAGALPAGAARTSGERREELDAELRESLSDFDRLLLREQEILARRAEATPPSGGSGDHAGGGGFPGEGGETTAGETGSSADPGASGGADDTSGGSTDLDTGERPASTGASPGSGDDEDRGDRVPPDVGSGNDDDIVARQLREAALAEDDPELRARLWDEYRAYKGLPRRPDNEADGDG